MNGVSLPADRAADRAERWLDIGRWATIIAACSSMVSPPLTNGAMSIMIIALLASGQAAPRLRQACTQPLGVGTLLLIGVLGIGMLWSEVPWPDRWDAFWSWRKLWIIPFALALFGPHVWKQRLIVAYIATCAIAVFVSFAIVVATGRLPTDVTDLAGRLLRNHSAQSMALAAATFLALLLTGDSARPQRWRLAAAACAALFVLNMAFVTPGRSGLLALAVMLIVLAVANVRNRRAALATAALGLMVASAIAVSPLARDRLALGWTEWRGAAAQGHYSSMGIRAVMYENTLELVREHPWLGTGTGGFRAAYAAKVQQKYTDWRAMPTVDPHNQYLFCLAEQGILGLFAFLLYIGLALADRGDGSRARLAAAGLLLGWCATSLLSSHFKTFAEGHLLALFLGALLARPVPRLDMDSAEAAQSPSQLKSLEPPRRVLIVSLRFLGDALLSTPLARAVKQRWPDCTIDVLVFRGTEGMFEGNRDIASVIGVSESGSARDSSAQMINLWRRYDLALITQTGTRPFFFGFAASARRVALVSPDLGKSWWKRALLHRYAVQQPDLARAAQNRIIARLIGIDDAPSVIAPSAGWTPADISEAVGFDVAVERFAIVHPSPRWRYKQWTNDGWQRLIRALVDAGLRVVVTGGPGAAERAYLDHVLQGLENERLTRVDARWSLAQTADALRQAALYVGPDTATTHLAAACGTPMVALYGPTDPSIWGPWPAFGGAAYMRVAAEQLRGNVLLLQNPTLACVPCQREGCLRHRDSHAQCLDELPADRVIAAALAQLRRGARHPASAASIAAVTSS